MSCSAAAADGASRALWLTIDMMTKRALRLRCASSPTRVWSWASRVGETSLAEAEVAHPAR